MASTAETLQVSLQEDGFCIATGPHDFAIVYPCLVKPFAPVILDSPVVLHLYCPELFPQQVLKVHAEHLGHFLALQNVPQISQEYERELFQGLCNLFTRGQVISLYKETLTDYHEDEKAKNRVQCDYDDDGDFYQSVFRTGNVNRNKARQTVSLLCKLLGLFDLKALCEEVTCIPGVEPQHMLFLYLIQLLVIYVSNFIPDRDLATIISVASAPFLEGTFCDPLCAATVLKPMFIPCFENARKRGECQVLKYTLFKGYEIDNSGSDVSQSLDSINWTHPSLQACIQGPKLREKGKNKLWFVAPQFGDRMDMVSQGGLKMMGGQTGEKPLRILQYLMCDNLLAYVQCAVFGTIYNMLPCHANSEFTEDVMSAIDYSMSRFAQELRRQSFNLMMEQRSLTGNCLYISGVGFAGQDKGATLSFGKVFTGSEDSRPTTDQNRLGVFTSVMVGVSDKTQVSNMLNIALTKSSEGTELKDKLSTRYRPAAIEKITSNMYFFGRYHHMFNAGEFTEICFVKPMSDPKFIDKIHQDCLKKDSKYQLSVTHGALPMCTLTLVMTVRQSVIMAMGLLCAELARTIYKTKTTTDNTLCKAITSLNMPARFRHKDEEMVNVFHAKYGETLKFTGPAFSSPGKTAINYNELDRMEWLQANDTNLPSAVTNGLNKIGDVKMTVQAIMKENSLCYNKVLFLGPFGKINFSTFFATPDYTIHAPMMTYCSLRTFTGDLTYGGVKLARIGSYYPVKVYSNSCINTKLYRKNNNLDIKGNATLTQIIEIIKSQVSGVKPRIEIDRIRLIAPELNQDQFDSLVLTLEKEAKINVLGDRDFARFAASKPDVSGKRGRDEDSGAGNDESDDWPIPLERKTFSFDNDLTICELDDMNALFDN